jgi:hypothetical protein
MKPFRIPFFLVIASVAFLGAGCSKGISDEQLKNLAYPAGDFASNAGGDMIPLTNGTFAFPGDAGSGNGNAQLEPVTARGDLNGDGSADAIAVVGINTGGTGFWSNVYVVLNDHGEPKPYLTPLPRLDDRDDITGIAIQDGVVTFELTTHAPDDAACCPSQHVTQTFRLQGTKLVPNP